MGIATEHFAGSPNSDRLNAGLRLVKRRRKIGVAGVAAIVLLLGFAWIAWQSAAQTSASPPS